MKKERKSYWITGDKDLLDLKKIGHTIVLKYNDFDIFISDKK